MAKNEVRVVKKSVSFSLDVKAPGEDLEESSWEEPEEAGAIGVWLTKLRTEIDELLQRRGDELRGATSLHSLGDLPSAEPKRQRPQQKPSDALRDTALGGVPLEPIVSDFDEAMPALLRGGSTESWSSTESSRFAVLAPSMCRGSRTESSRFQVVGASAVWEAEPHPDPVMRTRDVPQTEAWAIRESLSSPSDGDGAESLPLKQFQGSAVEMRGSVVDRLGSVARLGSMVFNGTNGRELSTSTPLGAERVNQMYNNQTSLQRFTRHWTYEAGSALVIVANAVFVAIETQQRAVQAPLHQSGRVPQNITATIVGLLFSLIFAVDLGLRIASGPSRFLTSGRERSWNIFDIVVVCTGVLEALTTAADASDSLVIFLRKFSVLRVIRLLRVIRMRIISNRVLTFIRELRLMVFSLTGAVRALMWSVVLLGGVLLVFGIFFTDGTVVYCVSNDAFADDALGRYFGTLARSMLTLFMAMSGGDDWINILDALQPLSSEYTAVFLVFIVVTLLAFLNVITAVFIETAMQQASNDKEMMVQQEIADQEKHMSIMRQVYHELDTNNNGEVSFEEFQKHINDERIQAYLQKLELDASQIQMLFKLLDRDHSGGVEAAEFVQGCMRLRGQAKAVDVAFLTSQVDYILESIEPLLERLSPLGKAALPPGVPPFSQTHSDRSDAEKRGSAATTPVSEWFAP